MQKILLSTLFIGCFGLLQAQFQQTSGPAGSLVHALKVNASGHIFAGTHAGIYRSTDNGENWTWLKNGFPVTDVQCIAINASGHLFAGTYFAGIYRSIDNGNSWLPVNNGLATDFVHSIAIQPDGDLFAAAGFDMGPVEVYRSTNNGDSWQKTDLGMPDDIVQAIVSNSNGDVFAGTSGSGIFRSTNNGDNWNPASIGLPASIVHSLAVNSSNHLFAGIVGKIYRSIDNGNSWVNVSTGLTIGAFAQVNSFAINAGGTLFAATYGSGVFRSMDNGASWTAINTGLTNGDVKSIITNNSGHVFAGVNLYEGIYRSTDNGNNWTIKNKGLVGSTVKAVAANAAGHIFAGTYYSGMYRSADNGTTWTEINTGFVPGERTINAMALNAPGHLFAGVANYNFSTSTSETGMFRSTNNGDSWSMINTGLSNTDVRDVAVSSTNHIYVATAGGVFLSTNNGDSWSPVNSGITNTYMLSLAINASGHVLAGNFSGDIFLTTNNGSSWSKLKNTGREVRSIAINAAGQIFASTIGNGIYRSIDNGVNWTQVNNGLTNLAIQDLVISANGDIYAASFAGMYGSGSYSGGVFKSTDNGDTWSDFSGGLNGADVRSMVINSGGNLFSGTGRSGVYRQAVSTTTAIATVQSGAWTTPATWAGGVVPAATDDVEIEAGHDITINTGGNVTVKNLTVRAGGSISLSGRILSVNGTLDNAGSLSLAGPARIGNDLINQSGATLDATGGATVRVAGANIINNGVFNFANGTVLGASNLEPTTVPQTISGTGSFTLANVALSNTGGITMAVPLTMRMLQIYYGKFYLGNNDLTVHMGSNSVGNANTYVVTDGTGRMRWTPQVGGDVSAILPVGRSSNNPIQIHNNTALHVFSVSVNDNLTHPAYSPSIVNSEWDVKDETGGAVSVDITLYWTGADEGPGFNRNNCYISHYDGARWIPLISPRVAPAGSGYFILRADGITGFSPFAVGSGHALPVELIKFTSKINNGQVRLDWSVENEINLLQYDIERSEDGNHFSTVKTITAAGKKDYSTTDMTAPGKYYYRLKMVDRDGSVKYSAVLVVDIEDNLIVRIYPNPATDKLFIRQPNNFTSIQLVSLHGQIIRQYSSLPQDFISLHGISKGQYILRLVSKNNTYTFHFIKH